MKEFGRPPTDIAAHVGQARPRRDPRQHSEDGRLACAIGGAIAGVAIMWLIMGLVTLIGIAANWIGEYPLLDEMWTPTWVRFGAVVSAAGGLVLAVIGAVTRFETEEDR